MSFITSFVTIFIFLIISTKGEINESQDESTQFDELLKQDHTLVALFTQACCACTDCVEAEVLLGGMSQELEDNLGLLVVRLKSEEMKKRFGIKRLPTLLYTRNNKTAIYSGKFDHEILYAWLQDNIEPATVDLDDSSFEHLTQAATGATTGDWLVIFHDDSCCKNRELMHLETAGVKLKNKVNVASVNILKAPETKERFKINTCPHIILFRHQKLYRFSLPDVNSKTLKRFAESFYKNSKSETVPPPLSMFDKILDKTFEYSKQNPYFVIAFFVLFILSTTLFLIWTIMTPSSHKKSD
ncbi:uncharacterized protein [Parasteatoda tepidariorum]|uniref:uncharacterized protein n=1 Tax=Parasteatoda tepidariorum TaxID=114398 RepID=UPI00077FDA8A|nr:uncharacterized protein LOC107444216 [Parasteatoda tepidariorum]